MSLPPQIGLIRFTDSYDDTFALIVEWNIGMAMGVFLLIFILLIICKKTIFGKLTKKEELVQENMNENKSAKQAKQANGSGYDQPQSQKQMHKSHSNVDQNQSLLPLENQPTCLDQAINVIFYIFWILCAYLVINLYMFNLFGKSSKIKDVFTFIVVAIILTVPITIWKLIRNKHLLKQSSSLKKYSIQIIFWIMLSFFLIMATKDVCVCQFNTQYGVNLLQDASISTAFSRTLTLGTICHQFSICHIYATLPQNTASGVFINIHTGLGLKNITITFQNGNQTVKTKHSSSPYHFVDVEAIGHRLVHSVLIDRLTASTTYNLSVSDKNGNILHSTTYRTLPDRNTDQLRMIVGGDVGLTQQGKIMTNLITGYDPDVILLGGDIAYDDAMRTCYYSWDNFYNMFQKINQKINRIVPMVLSIGNHDAGFDALGQVYVDKRPDYIPLFFLFNPQHSGAYGTSVPDIQERDSVHYHRLGPVLLINLDSGYIRSYKEQRTILENIVAQNTGYLRFANYHNPIYPSCTDSSEGSNDRKVIEQGLKYWVPIFDNLNFTTVMEHHTHFRKMTYRLRNDSIDSEKGVRYIGDGSWGVTDELCSERHVSKRMEVLEDYGLIDPNHMWQLTLTRANSSEEYAYKLNYTAVNLQGNVIITKIDGLSAPV